MNILLILIIFICNKISMNFAFTSSNRLLQTTNRHVPNNDTQPQQFHQDLSSVTNQFISIPGYRTKNNSNRSSAIFCSSNSSSYPLKSVVVSNFGSASKAILSVPNQPSFMTNKAIARGPLLIFDNPPISQCYLLKFPSQTSGVNSIDMNNIKVQFIYDPTSSNIRGQETRSMGSNIGYGSSSNLFTSNTNAVCGSVICQNGGICQSMGANGYQCQCDSSGQWLGKDCSKSNPCMWSPCYNNGECYYLPDATYYCVCLSGYTGNKCQYSLVTTVTTTVSSNNPCSSASRCLNGGTCLPQSKNRGFTCVCPQGYTGTNCQSSNHVAIPTTLPPKTCGASPLEFDRIVNGQSVYSHTWPWIISLQTKYGQSHFCGGTLVDAFHVVTAAHCFNELGTTPSTYQVVAGLLNLRQANVPSVQKLAVDRIFRHEGYNPNTLVNDITVIKLRTAAQITEAVYPICLPSANGAQDPKVGESVFIGGWGYTDSATKKLADQLQQAVIQILDINGDLYGGPGCSTWLRQSNSLTNNQQICAMSRDTRTDSCQGDSGGPLIGQVGSLWYLFGIVSYGDAVCASSTSAGVYTRVSAYTSWIQQKLQL